MELYNRRTAPRRHDTWFVYGLVDSRSQKEIRYIGITNDPRRRLSHHHSTILNNSTRKARWISKTVRDGGDVFMVILRFGLSHENAKEIERAEISSRNNLTNLTDGGDGTIGRTCSAETREKIAASRRGKPLAEETRAKLRFANAGRVSPNKGKVLPREWRANISAGGVRRMSDLAIRENLSAVGVARYADAQERQRTAVATRLAGPSKDNKSGFKGVSFQKRTQKWVAQIKIGKQTALGRFPTPEEAAHAYDKAAFAAWGSDCYLNFPADMAA